LQLARDPQPRIIDVDGVGVPCVEDVVIRGVVDVMELVVERGGEVVVWVADIEDVEDAERGVG
jgi:hypothetical protein